MKGYTPDLFDRLLGLPVRNGVVAARLTIEELKDAVARDLEALEMEWLEIQEQLEALAA